MANDFTHKLAQLRASIDAIDDELIALLKRRIGIIHQVADLKRVHTPAACHIRPGREGEMHRRIYDAFADTDFPPAAALAVWRQIIGASTHLESPITIAVAGGHDLRWQAREYFGRNVLFIMNDSITDALKSVETKHATIAVLPAPNDANLGEWGRLPQHPSLKLFASLPVALAASEKPAAYAVAAVSPETSGKDVSLLLIPVGESVQGHVMAENATHQLIAVDGVSTDARSLGTAPAPITDPSLASW